MCMLPRRKDEESICKFTTLPVILEISTNFCVAWVLSFWRTQINLMVQNRTELSASNIYKIDPARARKQLRCKFHSGGNLAQDPEPFQFACFLHIIAPSSYMNARCDAFLLITGQFALLSKRSIVHIQHVENPLH
jgi:hypothetical protein